MTRKRQDHTSAEFDLDILSSDTDMFRWFLLCLLFGKPIQSGVAVTTWKLLIEKKLDTPWAIVEASNHKLTSVLHRVATRAMNTSPHTRSRFAWSD